MILDEELEKYTSNISLERLKAYIKSDDDTISDVMETGANDVYEITLESGKTVLVPAIKDCILDVDIEGRRMEIHLMEGLMD